MVVCDSQIYIYFQKHSTNTDFDEQPYYQFRL